MVLNMAHNHQQQGVKKIPKGCIAVTVGKGEEEQKPFVIVIPVTYLNHPLFIQLLEEAEELYGFHHNGPINLPCNVDEFFHVRALVDMELNHRHHHHHHLSCFKLKAC